ncbi:lysylphosphatidylglycerol synthase transmembrane domain-containing protein [Miltoncostaea marina]|uniref:lysylphosphatidylglycerol synthase transmembrane domain-containing protein n=1 Tax=Miltoncostaea marina TaxID=2843215 RepID=UPI001C3E4894|nr:lysylphosphatidylglycerol synthase transmembrane domain-containing protein [Miltoncostaea marina]
MSTHAAPLTHARGPRLRAALRRPRVRRGLIAGATVAMLALAAWGAMHAVQPGAFARAFASADWSWVLASALLYAVSQVASALVWRCGLTACGLGALSRRHVVNAHFIGHGACELLPAQLGQVVRYAAIRRHPVAADGCPLRLAGSVGAHKALDGVVTFIVVAVAALVIPLPSAVSGLRWVSAAVLAGLLIALVLAWRSDGERMLARVPRRLQPLVRGLAHGGAIFTSRRHALAAVGFQLVAVGARVLSLAVLLHAFGMPAGAALLVFALMVLSGVLAITPGGVGVREAALVPALVATYGLGTDMTLAFSLGIQATALAATLVCAAFALLSQQLWPPTAAAAAA